MATKGKHLIIATGGTGGHFYPALAIALEHERQGGVVTLLVAGHNTARHLETARKAGLAAFACSAPRPPGGLLGRVAFPVQFLRACLGARRLIKRLRPDLVLGMGSFACVPVCLMAARARVPLFLHEGNAMVGRANLFLSRRARLLAASLPLVPGQKCRCPTRLTGMPLRPEILRVAAIPCDRAKTGESFGFTERKPVLLVFGGSLGAEFLNGVMTRVPALLGDHAGRLQVIHLTGADDNHALEQAYSQAGMQAFVRAYENHIQDCYSLADLVVCRAGGSTLAELAVFGKPAILVPFPAAANDHQTANAQVMAEAGAALHLPQKDATPEALAELIRSWLDCPDAWADYARNIRRFGHPRASAAIVEIFFTPEAVRRTDAPTAS
ncbi:MAG: UDP-N-acetylglucosamine--N-acetylmuramyl-(pentapeptide) pyrophosphoryl-undecaprenol N-acetylglucosamine transferase [candidate division BRC1 bacterium ADurb.BinA292]|nr:MAG: UDP-N-acetylglucosamine--N-acetylmuramyl-(pentapeptide) pyrophosphoryl-undecaprenol N-acetylglucosamine transferase [candidate division BRC1 bacterium ADurb.BinA292]